MVSAETVDELQAAAALLNRVNYLVGAAEDRAALAEDLANERLEPHPTLQ